MKITRETIMDLLPVYLSGEASQDTKVLVEEFSKNDPELVDLINKMKENDFLDVPKPLRKEVEMESYKKANLFVLLRTLGLATIIVLGLIAVMSFVGLMFYLPIFNF